jgi:hypothetical protein
LHFRDKNFSLRWKKWAHTSNKMLKKLTQTLATRFGEFGKEGSREIISGWNSFDKLLMVGIHLTNFHPKIRITDLVQKI